MAIIAGFAIPVAVCSHLSWCLNLDFGLRCRRWSAATGAVTSDLSTAFKTTDPSSNVTNTCGILTAHASQTCVSLYRVGVFQVCDHAGLKQGSYTRKSLRLEHSLVEDRLYSVHGF